MTVHQLLTTTPHHTANHRTQNIPTFSRMLECFPDGDLPHVLEDLLAHVLGVARAWLFAHPEAWVHPACAARFRRLAARLRRGEPLAHLLGEQWFFGRPFRVTRDVLIPRPETELLVELATRQTTIPYFHDRENRGYPTIIDVGTGSGCIAITLAAELPHARVIATDISPAALRVARANARRNGVADRITFLHGDLLAPLFEFTLSPRRISHRHRRVARYREMLRRRLLSINSSSQDTLIIIANLPYLTTNEWRALPHFALRASRGKPRSLRAYEPRTALDGGPDGLTPYRKLFGQLRNTSQISNFKFQIFLEIDPRRKISLTRLIRHTLPGWRATFHRDLAGRWRVLELTPEQNERSRVRKKGFARPNAAK